MKISTLRLIRFKLYINMGAGFGLTEGSLSQLSKVLPKIRSLGVEVRYSEVYELESWYYQWSFLVSMDSSYPFEIRLKRPL